MTKINNVSDVFREAKNHLWDGVYWSEVNSKEVYICYTIDRLRCGVLGYQAKEIIMSRFPTRIGKAFPHYVESYLQEVLNISDEQLTDEKVQKYRKDWLTALEKEFKPKLKPKKGFYI